MDQATQATPPPTLFFIFTIFSKDYLFTNFSRLLNCAFLKGTHCILLKFVSALHPQVPSEHLSHRTVHFSPCFLAGMVVHCKVGQGLPNLWEGWEAMRYERWGQEKEQRRRRKYGEESCLSTPDFLQLILHFRDYPCNPSLASLVTQESSLCVPVWSGICGPEECKLILLAFSGRKKKLHTIQNTMFLCFEKYTWEKRCTCFHQAAWLFRGNRPLFKALLKHYGQPSGFSGQMKAS